MGTRREMFKYIVLELITFVLKKPCKYILRLMFSILKQNGKKRKIKLSLLKKFLISIHY